MFTATILAKEHLRGPFRRKMEEIMKIVFFGLK